MGITYSQFFLLQAVLSISIFIFEVPCGYITDKIGYRKTLILNSLFTFLARILLLFAGNFLLFYIEAIYEGISIAFYSGTMSGYLYQLSDKQFAHSLSVVDNYSHLGFILSTLTFPLIYSEWGIDGLLIMTSFCSFIGFLIINFFYIEISAEFHIDKNYMSVLILLYTTIQLSVPKLTEIFGENNPFKKICVWSGISILLIFSIPLFRNRFVFLPMLLLPTVLSLLSIYFEKYQNNYIDRMGYEQQRVTILSRYNMSGNIVEILFLFVSAKPEKIQVYDIFTVLGCVFCIILLLIFIFQTRKN